MLVGDLGTWPIIVEIGGREERVVEGRRLEYGGGGIEENLQYLNNLKEVENLESLD